MSNRSGVGKIPKILGWGWLAPPSWDGGVLTVRKMLPPRMSYRAIFGYSKSNYTSVIKEIPKIWPLEPLSRSLRITRTDTDRSATYDFLLVFHSNRDPDLAQFPR